MFSICRKDYDTPIDNDSQNKITFWIQILDVSD